MDIVPSLLTARPVQAHHYSCLSGLSTFPRHQKLALLGFPFLLGWKCLTCIRMGQEVGLGAAGWCVSLWMPDEQAHPYPLGHSGLNFLPQDVLAFFRFATFTEETMTRILMGRISLPPLAYACLRMEPLHVIASFLASAGRWGVRQPGDCWFNSGAGVAAHFQGVLPMKRGPRICFLSDSFPDRLLQEIECRSLCCAVSIIYFIHSHEYLFISNS